MIPASQIPANLPAHIREQDAAAWRDWMNTRNVSDVNTKRTYVRHLSGFYQSCKLPIRQASEADIVAYEMDLRESGKAAATIKHTINTTRSYWTFARQEVSKV